MTTTAPSATMPIDESRITFEALRRWRGGLGQDETKPSCVASGGGMTTPASSTSS